MAFPVPTHLPRKQDVSSQILNKISQATSKDLNATLAAIWLAELDETIRSTKTLIHDRIHTDLPNFERQLGSSKSVQTRLQHLTNSVKALDKDQSDVVTTLIDQLTAHSTLSQGSADADVSSIALSHLAKCRSAFNRLEALVTPGRFPEAVGASVELETLLDQAPAPLGNTTVMFEIRRQFRALRDRTEEQLSEAYSRSVLVTASQISIHPSVQIRQSETVLSLSDVLSALSPSSLTAHLMSLRRELTTHHIEHILAQPVSLQLTNPTSITTSSAHILTQIPAPPSPDALQSLDNLTTVLDFVATHLVPSLPPSQQKAFSRSLAKPITDAVLQHLLISSLPSSFDDLPGFLELLAKATSFEKNHVLLPSEIESEGTIKMWADGVGGHYERKRRLEILDDARKVILRVDSKTFQAEETRAVAAAIVVPVQDEVVEPLPEVEEENGWGFDDEEEEDEPEPEPEPELSPEIEVTPAVEDAWGWNDDEDDGSPTEDDDPWDDAPAPSPVITSPKIASGLQKFSAKKVNGSTPSSATSSIFPSSASNSSVFAPSPLSPNFASPPQANKRPPSLAPPPPPETYLVSERSREIIRLVESALREGTQFASSNIIALNETSSAPGTLLLQSATSALDLFRALYPVVFSSQLARSPETAMKFSNDCLYLSLEVGRIVKAGNANASPALLECEVKLGVVGDSWFDDSIEKQRQAVDSILTAANGFADTGEQERYDECEEAVGGALREIRNIAFKWKDVLSKGKYYTAVGLVADAALSRVLEDVLRLPDIPDAESRRLSELCRIFNALEGLFVEDHNQPSFVVAYVPSWLKFSYLSELLEASMADITYLFEQGALVDFTVEELATLVRALFADTTLRATTIAKLLEGHPKSTP